VLLPCPHACAAYEVPDEALQQHIHEVPQTGPTQQQDSSQQLAQVAITQQQEAAAAQVQGEQGPGRMHSECPNDVRARQQVRRVVAVDRVYRTHALLQTVSIFLLSSVDCVTGHPSCSIIPNGSLERGQACMVPFLYKQAKVHLF
jgi:hypothetical protein